MILTHEATIRLGAFLSVLTIMGVWELVAPRRELTARKTPRWATHLGLVALNTFMARLVLPVTAVTAAATAEGAGWGALRQVAWPDWVEIALALVALDLIIYASHVLFHRVPLLWRLHRVHHADLDLDVTSGVRFHTLEILASALLKVAAVVALGASPTAVVLFEVLLNATALFNHSNVRLAAPLDRCLRCVLVTPDMHRVHHSVRREETNSNYGFNIPWWDYLFRTYHAQPADGHQGMTIGLAEFRDERQVERLDGILLLPISLPRDVPGERCDAAGASRHDRGHLGS